MAASLIMIDLVERNRAYQKKWRQSEKCRAYQRKYQRERKRQLRATKEGRESDRAITRKYLASPKGKIAARASRQKYKRTTKGRACDRAGYHRRRALQLNALSDPQSAMKTWISRMLAPPRLHCHWCSSNVPRAKRTHDHIIPLSGGGSNTVANSCMACGPCNYSKGAKDPLEWNGQAQFRYSGRLP